MHQLSNVITLSRSRQNRIFKSLSGHLNTMGRDSLANR
jgi:hypothetical protein